MDPTSSSSAVLDAEEEGVHTSVIEALLSLVSRAHALSAELLRLSRRVSPLVFNKTFHDKYKEVLFDFAYLKAPEHHEDKIERSLELLELSDALKEEYLPVFKRFFLLFETIVVYHQDLTQITDDLRRGAYIQSTIDGLLQDREGKQLILEAFSMLGVLLLLLDKEIPARHRQIVIVSTYRYVGTADIPNFEQICSLCANTPLQQAGGDFSKFPKGYPASLFSRLPIPKAFVTKIVTRLLSEDFYNQLVFFSAEGNHRSRALAHQAAMLFVLLYFKDDILETEFSQIRELFDKHFADNWVVCVYPTLYIDVTSAWHDYKAAQKAMASVITPERAREVAQRHHRAFIEAAKDVEEVLHDGVLNAKKQKSHARPGEAETQLEEHCKRITKIVQTCNVSMRWLLLNVFTEHSHSKAVRACVGGVADAARDIVKALLGLVVVENELLGCVRDLVATKKERWTRSQEDIVLLLSDLGAFYSGTQVLSRREEVKDEGLQKYSEQMARHVKKLDMSKPTSCGRKIQQIIQALKDVEDFHQLQVSLQTKEYLHRVRTMLIRMTHIASISDHDVRTCEVASDCSHAFQLFGHLVPHLHRRIAHDAGGRVRDSNAALRLRFLFVKLRSVLDWPLLRINEAESPDLQSVSEFWSGELVRFVTRVTECIPHSMFVKLDDIFALQTHKLRELPTKLERTQLRNYVFAQDRQDLARVTYSIAMLTEGMMKIETTQLGVEVVEPSVLLEKGVRKQLVKRMTQCLQRELTNFEQKQNAGKSSVTAIFSTSSSQQNRSKVFADQLALAGKSLGGIRRSLEYIQDYMQVHGLAIWQEEMGKLVGIMADRELRERSARTRFQDSRAKIAGRFGRKFGSDDGSDDYLLEAVEKELGAAESKKGPPQTFLGSVHAELLRLTSPFETIYSFPLCGWFSPSTGKEEVGLNTFELIRGAVAVCGTHALDRISQLEIYNEVRESSTFLNKQLSQVSAIPTRDNSTIIIEGRTILNPPDAFSSFLHLNSCTTNKIKTNAQPRRRR